MRLYLPLKRECHILNRLLPKETRKETSGTPCLALTGGTLKLTDPFSKVYNSRKLGIKGYGALTPARCSCLHIGSQAAQSIETKKCQETVKVLRERLSLNSKAIYTIYKEYDFSPLLRKSLFCTSSSQP